MKKSYSAPEMTVKSTVQNTAIAALIPTKSEIELFDEENADE